jgi:hypothetical protein
MTILRSLILGILILAAGVTLSSCRAEPAVAVPSATSHPGVGESGWGGPGGIYRIIATSAGVLLGASAMSVFIDGWVVDTFMSSSGVTLAEAAELVQDFDSQSGFEAAAIMLSGLAGGLVADRLYVEGAAVLPGAVEAVDDALAPPLAAVGTAWGWLRDRVGDGSDWLQARSRELIDRAHALIEKALPRSDGKATAP